ncbi:MAG: hypothetical protein WAU36_00015 [Cyclobacteriaceae bacterium]
MRTVTTIFATLTIVTSSIVNGFCQQTEIYPVTAQNEHTQKATLMVSSTAIRAFGVSVPGVLSVSDSKVKFQPQREFGTSWQRFMYPDNDLIRDFELECSQVRKIKRNWFYLFPNQIVIKTNDHKTFRFFSYKRRALINEVRMNMGIASL